jgi:hypothetical protein
LRRTFKRCALARFPHTKKHTSRIKGAENSLPRYRA